MTAIILAEDDCSQQRSGRGSPTATVPPDAVHEALREEWKGFSERFVKFMELRQARKKEMVVEHGWNSPESNDANEKLVSFHTRIRVDWHDRLRERDLHPSMCKYLFNAEEKELLVRLIGEPAFQYKAGENPDKEMAVPPLEVPAASAVQQWHDSSVEAAELGRRNRNPYVQTWIESLEDMSPRRSQRESELPPQPRPRVHVQHDDDKALVRITARIPDIRGPNISRTPDGDVEVTTLPILTSAEHSYLVSAGFLLTLDDAAQALESIFAGRIKEQHEQAANESRRAPAKGSALLQGSHTSGLGSSVDPAQADSKLFDEVRAEHVREIQTLYQQRRDEFKLLGVARECGLDLFAEDLMTLTKRNFGEEVDWILFDVDRQMMPTIMQDYVEYAKHAHRPELERKQYFELYRQRQARVEEWRAQKESMVRDRVVVEMRKFLGIGTLLPQRDTADEPELDPEVQRRALEARYPQFRLEREKKGPVAVSGLAHSSSAKDRRGVERPQDEGNQPESSAMAQRRWANPPNPTQAQPHKRWIPPPPSV
ncbi:hypothetical protein EVG20_g10762 [Dentipellis fragilis]|uniref:Uncharacterized protein n=1 Tax=Dentipellis fragilis TaxID=205917 RepID=A0A4Y9XQB1_9AGAM|nr:hypothetical protein EVG20_g10762 [Dentipellis fragilis]